MERVFSVSTFHFILPKMSTITSPSLGKQWDSTSLNQTATNLLCDWPIWNIPLDSTLYPQRSRSRVILVVGNFRDSVKIKEASSEMRSARCLQFFFLFSLFFSLIFYFYSFNFTILI